MGTWSTSLRSLAAASLLLGLTAWIAPPRTAGQAVQPAPAVDGQPVQYPSGGATIDAYIARPPGASKRPAVIVLHDDLGLNNRFRELTRQFAQAGFVALAPHLPSRSKTPASEPRQGGGDPSLGEDAGVPAVRISP